jgi:hypothetical protein
LGFSILEPVLPSRYRTKLAGTGHGSEALGIELGGPRGQECKEAGDRGGGKEAGGVAAPVVGDAEQRAGTVEEGGRFARLCSAGSSVLQSGPTPRHRSCGPFGFCLLAPDCSAPRGQSLPRSPGSRACSFSACTQGRPTARASAAGRLAFPFCPQGRRPELVLRSAIPGPPMPLSTLRPPPHDHVRKTQGQDGSLLLSCRTLSFPTTCRFIPAHRQATRISPQGSPSTRCPQKQYAFGFPPIPLATEQ